MIPERDTTATRYSHGGWLKCSWTIDPSLSPAPHGYCCTDIREKQSESSFIVFSYVTCRSMARSESLSGVATVTMGADVGLDSSRLWEGLSERSVFTVCDTKWEFYYTWQVWSSPERYWSEMSPKYQVAQSQMLIPRIHLYQIPLWRRCLPEAKPKRERWPLQEKQHPRRLIAAVFEASTWQSQQDVFCTFYSYFLDFW